MSLNIDYMRSEGLHKRGEEWCLSYTMVTFWQLPLGSKREISTQGY